MKKSHKPFEELQKARLLVEKLKNSDRLDDFEEQWVAFLHRLERVWSKSESHYRRSPKWDAWKGSFVKLRKNDPLLSYLKNARGAEEHTIEEIVERTPGGIAIGSGSSGPVTIKKMLIEQGRIMHLDADGPIKVTHIPEKIRLKSIINRGLVYSVPSVHLGKPISPNDVISLADLACDFYDHFLQKAEDFFVGLKG